MTNNDQLRQLHSLLENAQIILIMYGKNPSQDELTAAAGLHQSLKRLGKDVSLYSPDKPQHPELQQTSQETKTEIGHQNLVVSFNYSEEAVDKVSYHIGEEDNKFYLTIKPKRGHEPLEAESVDFSYTGAEADLILLVGVDKLENLEQLYFGYEDLYRNTPIVTFSSVPTNLGSTNFGTESAALSESVSRIIKELNLSLDSELATQLLRGIEQQTNNLQAIEVTADTFETVAYLLRSGGVRQLRFTKRSAVQEQQIAPQASSRQDPQQKDSRREQRDSRGENLSEKETAVMPEQQQQVNQENKQMNQETVVQPPRGVSKK